ncbi:two-component sensor histidine kinase [Parafrankia soli]|uniref:histidine kinase n=1 Tax=Parafrankia soli TaxID=2599596 RepID=A0A1S1PVL9_9ACTN|nr:two-component sensor histidine kinase [Parafrankia soli]
MTARRDARVGYRGGVRDLVRPLWEEPRPARPSTPGRRDWPLAAALTVAALTEGLLRADLPWRTWSVLLALALVPTLLWRRARPLAAVTIAFGASAVASVLTGGGVPQLNSMIFMLLLPYSLLRWGSGREAVTGAAVVLAAAAVCMISAATGAADAVGGAAVLLASFALGGAFRYRAGARLRELEQAKLLERERLARDLHDTVAHHVSAIAIRAQAGIATAPSSPAAAAEALRVIELEASRTLAEMRAMVRVLRRDEPAELAPNPTVADLERLAGQARSGPAVRVRIVGEVGNLPPSVGSAIYRLAQESITNARRHARHANHVEVVVSADDACVRLSVRDDGDTAALHPPPSPGYGLTGMIERARLLGGTCEAGPAPDRGWTVTATLPRAGWAT